MSINSHFDENKLKELKERILYGIDITFENFARHSPDINRVPNLWILKHILKDEIINHALFVYFKKKDNNDNKNNNITTNTKILPPPETLPPQPKTPLLPETSETIVQRQFDANNNSSSCFVNANHHHYHININSDNNNRKRKRYDTKKVCIYCKEYMELDRYPTDKNIFWKCRKGCKNINGRINKVFLDDLKKPKSKEYWINHYIFQILTKMN